MTQTPYEEQLDVERLRRALERPITSETFRLALKVAKAAVARARTPTPR